MRLKHLFLTTAGVLALGLGAQAATYSGNGNSGFGGTIGLGSLTLTDDGTTISGTLTTGGDFNDALVIYIDSVSGGFSDTSGFGDNADGGRTAISGYNGTDRSTMTFMSGFSPDFALMLGPVDNSFGGVWQLANGGANSLPYVDTANLSNIGNASAGTYTFSFTLADIGLTPNSGSSFKLFGTYISNSAYRSDEAIAGNATGTQGWSDFTQTAYATYTTTVPEPASAALFGLAGLTLLAFRRRK